MALGHSPQIVRDGLVLHLDAANVKSYAGTGTIWFDLSGHNNNVVLENGPIHSTDGYFSFDGSDDYCTLPNDSSMDTDYKTMSVWIRSTFVIGPRSRHYIFDALGHYSAIFIDEPNEVNYAIFSGGNFYTITYTDVSISNDTWLNITGTYDGVTLKLYVNGNLVNSLSHTGVITPSNQAGRLMDYIGNGYETEGLASQFFMYNRALSAEEIKQNFEAYRDRYGI